MCKFSSREIQELRNEELETMRYVLQHSRHQASAAGAAPNTTSSPMYMAQQERRRYEQTSSRDTVRVLRFPAV